MLMPQLPAVDGLFFCSQLGSRAESPRAGEGSVLRKLSETEVCIHSHRMQDWQVVAAERAITAIVTHPLLPSAGACLMREYAVFVGLNDNTLIEGQPISYATMAKQSLLSTTRPVPKTCVPRSNVRFR